MLYQRMCLSVYHKIITRQISPAPLLLHLPPHALSALLELQHVLLAHCNGFLLRRSLGDVAPSPLVLLPPDRTAQIIFQHTSLKLYTEMQRKIFYFPTKLPFNYLYRSLSVSSVPFSLLLVLFQIPTEKHDYHQIHTHRFSLARSRGFLLVFRRHSPLP